MICFSIGGATNVQGKQLLHLIYGLWPKSPVPGTLYYGVAAWISENSKRKVLDCQSRLKVSLDKTVTPPAENNILEGIRTNQLMWSFVSDSPNVTKKLRKMLRSSESFAVVFGCAPHALNNFSLIFWSSKCPPKLWKKQCSSWKISDAYILSNRSLVSSVTKTFTDSIHWCSSRVPDGR